MRKFILSDISLNGLWSTLMKTIAHYRVNSKPGEGGMGEVSNVQFCNSGSVVRTIWGSRDLVLLIFAGSAAEFALNRAVDWLFFTGKIPRDPIARLFSTVSYAQQIVFGDEETAYHTLDKINTIHGSVEQQRRQKIPDWAYRDVLYMLIDYSERAYQLLYRPLTLSQKEDLFKVFQRIGGRLLIPDLPESYAAWRVDRQHHLVRDLSYSRHTAKLFQQYRRHLGLWRYHLLLQVQALLVPHEVRRMLHLSPNILISNLTRTYGIIGSDTLRSLVHTMLIPPRYWAELQKLDGPGKGRDR